MKKGNPWEHWTPKTEEDIQELLKNGHRIPSFCLGLPIKTKENTIITIYHLLLRNMEREYGGLVLTTKSNEGTES
jgi:hypothetical protein